MRPVQLLLGPRLANEGRFACTRACEHQNTIHRRALAANEMPSRPVDPLPDRWQLADRTSAFGQKCVVTGPQRLAVADGSSAQRHAALLFAPMNP
jgi:hypothetical protein